MTTTQEISGGVVHELPDDLRKALLANPKALELWETKITPLGRNEWICWVIAPKKQETRDDHVKRTVSEILEGMRRPCCWIGCIHRTDKPVSKSVQWVLDKQAKKPSARS